MIYIYQKQSVVKPKNLQHFVESGKEKRVGIAADSNSPFPCEIAITGHG